MEKTTVLEFLQQNLQSVEQVLTQLKVLSEPKGLYEPVSYILDSKGKRLRPQLTLAAADAFSGDRDVAVQVGTAMEVFHIFTLVHDDIMDKAETRRGRTTIHTKWDEATAILVGDYLMGKAGEMLLALPDQQLRSGLERFSLTVRELCEGQIRDMEFETSSNVSMDAYLQMIDQKTSALIKTSLILGGLTGNADKESLQHLDQIGFHMGRAFQIQDDLLDLTADSDDWGKPVGGDLMSGKKAYLLLEALRVETSTGNSYFHRVAENGGLASTEVDKAKHLLDEMGVLSSTQNAVRHHSNEALRLAKLLPESLGRLTIESLIEKMAVRSH